MFDILTDCILTILNELLKQFKNSKVSYEDFLSHTELKLKFVKAYLEEIGSPGLKAEALHLIQDCEDIINNEIPE